MQIICLFVSSNAMSFESLIARWNCVDIPQGTIAKFDLSLDFGTRSFGLKKGYIFFDFNDFFSSSFFQKLSGLEYTICKYRRLYISYLKRTVFTAQHQVWHLIWHKCLNKMWDAFTLKSVQNLVAQLCQHSSNDL